MIVVDANVIAYAVIPGARTTAALAAIEMDPEWVAPPLWRSELRNILATSVRTKRLTRGQASRAWAQAERLVIDATLTLDFETILGLSVKTGASAYDCEYVALAKALGVALLTADGRLAQRFPYVASTLERFADSAD